MNLHTCILTENDCYKRGRTIRPQGVMVHSTGANNPWLQRYVQPDDGLLGQNQYGNHWNRSGLEACVHAFIGKLDDGTIATYQTLPWNHRGWHCGRSGNDTHISFEICEDDLTSEAYFNATCREAAELTAHLCKQFGLDPLAPGVVVDHAEGNALGIASGHSDVGHWWRRFGYTMDDFRRDVAELMKEEPEMTREEVEKIAREAAAAAVTEAVEKAVANAMGPHYTRLGDVKQPGYRPMLEKLAEKGYLKGREGAGADMVIDLNESDVRALVIMGRALEAAGLLD